MLWEGIQSTSHWQSVGKTNRFIAFYYRALAERQQSLLRSASNTNNNYNFSTNNGNSFIYHDNRCHFSVRQRLPESSLQRQLPP